MSSWDVVGPARNIFIYAKKGPRRKGGARATASDPGGRALALSLCGSLRSPRPRSRGRAGQGQFFYTLSKPKLSHHKQITRWSLSLGHKHTILANSSSTIFHNRIIMRSSMRPRAHSPL